MNADAGAGAPGPRGIDPHVVRALTREAFERAGEGRLTLASSPGEGGDARRMGRSMLPALAPGDEVAWRRPVGLPAIGDIVVVADRSDDGGGAVIVHRVVGIRPDGSFVTKGDNRACADEEPVRADEILGIVVAARRPGGEIDLASRRARRLARVTAWISAAGWALFAAAGLADGLLARVAPEVGAPAWSERLCARRVAWMVQRAGQLAWHALRSPFERAAGDGPDPGSGAGGERR